MKASVYLRFVALEERLDRIEALLTRLNDDQDDRAEAKALTGEVKDTTQELKDAMAAGAPA